MSFPDFPQHPAITWIPFHEAHLTSLRIDNKYSQSLSKVIPINQMIAAQAAFGQAYTALLHGRPVACFGAVRIWHGVSEMWLLMEDRARECKFTLTKAAIAFRDSIVLSENLHRLQITVRCEDMRAVKWGLAIGFTIDGMMKAYGPDGSDYYLMSRT